MVDEDFNKELRLLQEKFLYSENEWSHRLLEAKKESKRVQQDSFHIQSNMLLKQRELLEECGELQMLRIYDNQILALNLQRSKPANDMPPGEVVKLNGYRTSQMNQATQVENELRTDTSPVASFHPVSIQSLLRQPLDNPNIDMSIVDGPSELDSPVVVAPHVEAAATSFESLHRIAEQVNTPTSQRSTNTRLSAEFVFADLIETQNKEIRGRPVAGGADAVTERLRHELREAEGHVRRVVAEVRDLMMQQAAHIDQERVLKEQIRQQERDNHRDVELRERSDYLKNVLVKFISAQGDRTLQRNLLPIVTEVLHLSPAEKRAVCAGYF